MRARRQVCALCSRTDVLINSHLLPAAVYRNLRAPEHKNPNPFVLTENFSGTTSKQVRQPLLCRPCEELFHAKGEDWTFRRTLQPDGRFPLLETVQSTSARYSDPTAQVYVGVKGIEHLVYFAVSVFWRAGSALWRMPDGTTTGINLGPYQATLTKYLLGREALSDEVFMGIQLMTHPVARQLARLPSGGRRSLYKSYDFQIPGIQFFMWVGKAVPKTSADFCAIRTGSVCIAQQTEIEVFKWCSQTRWAAFLNKK